MTAPLVAVVVRHHLGIAFLDRTLFALAGQRHSALHVILCDQDQATGGSDREDLLALHARLGGFEFTYAPDAGVGPDPALPALAATGARRVLFLDVHAWLHPQHVATLSRALDESDAPLALARGRHAHIARAHGDTPPFVMRKRDLWPGDSAILPFDPLLPAASALLDLDRLHRSPEELEHFALSGFHALRFLASVLALPLPRATLDSLRVLDLLLERTPALVAGGPSFEFVRDSLPLRFRSDDLLRRLTVRARLSLKSNLGPLLRALRSHE